MLHCEVKNLSMLLTSTVASHSVIMVNKSKTILAWWWLLTPITLGTWEAEI
jgi:hypothetical protein